MKQKFATRSSCIDWYSSWLGILYLVYLERTGFAELSHQGGKGSKQIGFDSSLIWFGLRSLGKLLEYDMRSRCSMLRVMTFINMPRSRLLSFSPKAKSARLNKSGSFKLTTLKMIAATTGNLTTGLYVSSVCASRARWSLYSQLLHKESLVLLKTYIKTVVKILIEKIEQCLFSKS